MPSTTLLSYMHSLVPEILRDYSINDAELSQKEVFRNKLETLARDVIGQFVSSHPDTLLPEIKLQCYGSLGSGLGLKGSDMDLLLANLPASLSSEPKFVIPRLLEKALLDANLGARLLTKTRVPILKVCEDPTKDLMDALLEERARWDEEGDKSTTQVREGQNGDSSSNPPPSRAIIQSKSNAAQNLADVEIESKGNGVTLTSHMDKNVNRLESVQLDDSFRGSIQSKDDIVANNPKMRAVQSGSRIGQEGYLEAPHKASMATSRPTDPTATASSAVSVPKANRKKRNPDKTPKEGSVEATEQQQEKGEGREMEKKPRSRKPKVPPNDERGSAKGGSGALDAQRNNRSEQVLANLAPATRNENHQSNDNVSGVSGHGGSPDVSHGVASKQRIKENSPSVCWSCNAPGHVAIDCPSRDPSQPVPIDEKRARLEFSKTDCGVLTDINFSNDLALHNTLLLRQYCKCDNRVREMGVFVKAWAKRRSINNPYHGTLSSYGYILMVLHYLVNIAKIVPNLQALGQSQTSAQSPADFLVHGYDTRFLRDDDQMTAAHRRLNQHKHYLEPMGALLLGFFEYYGENYGFNWTQEVISLRSNGGLLFKKEKGWTGASTNESGVRMRYLLCIEDPFEVDHNVARTVVRSTTDF